MSTIVFFAHSRPFHPGTILARGLGGSESALIHLARELAAIGHTVHVFCDCDAPGEYDGVIYRNVSELRTFFQVSSLDLFVSIRIPEVLAEPIPTRLKWLWTGDSFDQSHIQALHDPSRIDSIDRIVTVSDWQAESYQRHFNIPEEKFYVSRNGFHSPFFEGPVSFDRSHKLVYSSTPFRGLDVLLDLFPKIRREVPDAELLIFSSMSVYGVSREEDEKEYGALYRKAEQPGVKLIGAIPQDRLAKELMQSALMAYPNHFAETSCIAAIEAQAAGNPVVTTALGGLNETVQDKKTGILIPGDSRSREYGNRFVREIVHLLRDRKKWRRFSQQARERAFQVYRWEVIANEWSSELDRELSETSKTQAGKGKIGGSKDPIPACQKKIAEDPRRPEPYNRLGLLYRDAGEPEKALAAFREAVSHYVLYDEAYENYRAAAESIGLRLTRDDLDIVFYTVGAFTPADLTVKAVGGSETALMSIARELARRGRGVIVFNETRDLSIHEGVEYRNLADFFLLNRWNRIPIFISSRVPMPFRAGVNAGRKIFWVHDDCQAEYIRNENLAALPCDEILTVSRWQTEAYAEHFQIPRDRFTITRNGIDPSLFPEEEYSRDRNRLIYTSRPDRGLSILLDLFPQIREEAPEAELHIFSYTPARELKEDPEMAPILAKLDQPGVVLRGGLPKQELYRELKKARLLLYPSIWRETSCIAVLEAQAAGTPVVTTPLAALPESVTGGVFIPGNPNSAAYREQFVSETLRLMKDDLAWHELSRQGEERIEQSHNWKTIAEEWDSNLQRPPCRPALSLCMIVRDEEKDLPRCLDSVKGVVDEIVIVDTGSTDRTREIARTYTEQVFSSPWKEDFSTARNESLQHASGDWILQLDADEWFEKTDAAKIGSAIVRTAPEVSHLFLERINLKKDGKIGTRLSLPRIFRNNRGGHFEGRIHEQLIINGKGKHLGLRFLHDGYGRYDDREGEKYLRNCRMIKREIETDPENPFHYHNLCLSLNGLGQEAQAIEAGRRAVMLARKKKIHPRYLLQTCYATASLHFLKGEMDAAQSLAEFALSIASDHPDAWYLLTLIAANHGPNEECLRAGQHFLSLLEKRKGRRIIEPVPVYTDGRDYNVMAMIGGACYRLGNRSEGDVWLIRAIEAGQEDHKFLRSVEQFYHSVGEEEKAGVIRTGLTPPGGIAADVDEETHPPRLSLCMIVKNEEEMLPRCLESIKDLAEEIVIVDTGSTDRTVEIARSFGAKIVDFPWNDNFSEARNLSLDHATGDWILILDADETLSAKDHETLREAMTHSNASAFDLLQRNYTQDAETFGWKPKQGEYEEEQNFSGYFDVRITRLFRRDTKIRFRHCVHERVEESLDEAGIDHPLVKVPIHHLGKARGDSFLRVKLEHYLRLARKKKEENPSDSRAGYEIGGTLVELGRTEEAIPCLEETCRLAPEFTDARSLLAIALYRAQRFNQAWEALKRIPVEKHNGSILKLMGIITLRLWKGEEAERAFRNALMQQDNEDCRVGLAQAQALQGKPDQAAATLDDTLKLYPQSPRALNDRGCIAFAEGKQKEAADYFRRVLEIEPGSHDAAVNLDRCRPAAGPAVPAAPKLSVCMMVKNEEEMLPRCLDAIKGHVDELIIVDTGSTDRTVEIARGYTDKIYFHPWEGDFSKARNQTLQYATGEWILQLDADEVVDPEDAPRLRKVIQELTEEVTHQDVEILNYDGEGSVNSTFHYPRLYRNGRGFHYEGIVHNQIRLTGEKIISGIRIHHYGYTLSPEKMTAKGNRTIELLKKQIAADPENPWPRHNLCLSCSMAKRDAEAVAAGEEAYRLARKRGIFPPWLYYGRYVVAATLCAGGEYDRAIAIARDCLKQDPDHLDSCYVILLSSYQIEDFPTVHMMGSRYLKILENYSRQGAPVSVPQGTLDFRPKALKMLGHAFFALGDKAKAAQTFQAYLDEDRRNPERYREIGLFYHGQGDTKTARSHYKKHLFLEPEDTYILKAAADCYTRERHDNEAVELYRKVLTIDPSDEEAQYLLGQLQTPASM